MNKHCHCSCHDNSKGTEGINRCYGMCAAAIQNSCEHCLRKSEDILKCPHGTIGTEGTSCPKCKKEPVNCGIPPEMERDPIHDTHIQYSQMEDATSWNPPQPKETTEEKYGKDFSEWHHRECQFPYIDQANCNCDMPRKEIIKSLKSRWQSEAREEQPIKNLHDERFICERCLEQKTIQEVKITKDYKIICYYHFFPNKSHD